MPKTNIAKKRGGDILMFARLLRQGEAACKAKEVAGFSKNYDTTVLMSAHKTQVALRGIDQQRADLQQAFGTTISDSVEFNRAIRDDIEELTKDRLKADDQIAHRLGYDAPKEVNVESRALILAFNDLSGNELNTLLSHYSEKELV